MHEGNPFSFGFLEAKEGIWRYYNEYRHSLTEAHQSGVFSMLALEIQS
jgi:hypothetical protein